MELQKKCLYCSGALPPVKPEDCTCIEPCSRYPLGRGLDIASDLDDFCPKLAKKDRKSAWEGVGDDYDAFEDEAGGDEGWVEDFGDVNDSE